MDIILTPAWATARRCSPAMDIILTLVLLAVAVWLGWLFFRWWNAPDHMTIDKVLVQVLEPPWKRLCCIARRLWLFWGPRLTNRALYVAAIADMTVLFGNNGSPFDQVLGHPMAVVGLVLFNLLTPLTPQGAPDRIAAPPHSLSAR